jgi:hypothetical protein
MNVRGSTFSKFQKMNLLAPFLEDEANYCGKDLISLKGGLGSEPWEDMRFKAKFNRDRFVEAMVLPRVKFLI